MKIDVKYTNPNTGNSVIVPLNPNNGAQISGTDIEIIITEDNKPPHEEWLTPFESAVLNRLYKRWGR